MIKLLCDSKRIFGRVDLPRGTISIVEYGLRDRDGILHIVGMARVISISEAGITKADVDELCLYEA